MVAHECWIGALLDGIDLRDLGIQTQGEQCVNRDVCIIEVSWSAPNASAAEEADKTVLDA